MRWAHGLFMSTPDADSGTSGVGVGADPGSSAGKPPLRCGTPISSAADAGDRIPAGDVPLEPAFDADTGDDAPAAGSPSKGGTPRETEGEPATDAEASEATGATGATGAGFGAARRTGAAGVCVGAFAPNR